MAAAGADRGNRVRRVCVVGLGPVVRNRHGRASSRPSTSFARQRYLKRGYPAGRQTAMAGHEARPAFISRSTESPADRVRVENLG